MEEPQPPLEGGQIHRFYDQLMDEAQRLRARAPAVRLPAFYVAGLVTRDGIAPEAIDAALESHKETIARLFLEGSDLAQQTSIMREALHAAYKAASKTSPQGARKPEESVLEMRPYKDSRTEPLRASAQPLFVKIALDKAARGGSSEYGEDMALLAGMLDAAGSITPRSIDSLVYGKAHIHPGPRRGALAEYMVDSLGEARNSVDFLGVGDRQKFLERINKLAEGSPSDSALQEVKRTLSDRKIISRDSIVSLGRKLDQGCSIPDRQNGNDETWEQKLVHLFDDTVIPSRPSARAR